MARGRKKEQYKSFPVSPSHRCWKLLSTGPAFKLKYYQEVVVVVEGSIFTVCQYKEYFLRAHTIEFWSGVTSVFHLKQIITEYVF